MHNDQHELTPVLIIGAGELGLAVLRAMAPDATRNRQALSVLLRPVEQYASREDADAEVDVMRGLGVSIVRADLGVESVDALAAIFADYTTVICCTGFVGGRGTQIRITTAALQARVARFVPWQFGVDYDIVGRGSGQEVFDEQADVRDLLRAQRTTDWVIVSTGMFTSFLFEPSFGLVDLDAGRVHALGRWDHQLTVTTPEDIGRLTAAVLAHTLAIRNEVVYVAGDTFTYTQLADTVDAHLGRRTTRVLWDIDQLRDAVASDPTDGLAKYRLAFARDTGVAWPLERTFNVAHQIPVTDVAAWLAANR